MEGLLMALTGKKKAFADAVLAGSSNKAAAIAAGYSPATASPAGSRLVKDKEVAAYLAKARSAPAKADHAAGDVKQPAGADQAFDLTKALQHQDPKSFLLAAMNDIELDQRQRIDAAKALMPFMHQKLGEGGKKEDAANKAKQAGAGRFKPAPTPLKLVGGK
jgi:phage terminase small subunit